MNNYVVILDSTGELIDEWETKFSYFEGDIINVNSGMSCKCKEVIQGLKNTTYVFVRGWVEYGF